ncbi:unnamed protein product, partial [Coregonus sp. 'balchen']
MQQIPHQKGQTTQINGGLSACNTSSVSLEASGETNSYSGSPTKRQTPSPGGKTTPTKKAQYNTPIGLYSAETLREMAQLQESHRGKGSAAGLSVGNEYVPNFNPNVLKDTALSTHKPIEVKGPGGKATIIHAQYNTPISMYSQDAIMDAIAGQSQSKGHEGGSLPVKDAQVDSASPVYQAVIKTADRDMELNDWARSSSQVQSKSFRLLAHITGTEFSKEKFDTEFKGPRFAKLKNWHNGLSAQILNVPEKALV